jgi:hypothetical protein
VESVENIKSYAVELVDRPGVLFEKLCREW